MITTEALELKMSKSKRMTEPMRSAIRSILIGGSTWRSAAQKSGITESGIYRALKRLGISPDQQSTMVRMLSRNQSL